MTLMCWKKTFASFRPHMGHLKVFLAISSRCLCVKEFSPAKETTALSQMWHDEKITWKLQLWLNPKVSTVIKKDAEAFNRIIQIHSATESWESLWALETKGFSSKTFYCMERDNEIFKITLRSAPWQTNCLRNGSENEQKEKDSSVWQL